MMWRFLFVALVVIMAAVGLGLAFGLFNAAALWAVLLIVADRALGVLIIIVCLVILSTMF